MFKMATFILLACLVACAHQSTFQAAQEDIQDLRDSITTLRVLLDQHEEYIGSDMLHKREQTEHKDNMLKEVADTDRGLLYLMIGLGFNMLLSGGHFLTSNSIAKSIILSLAAKIKRESKSEGG